MLDKFCTKLQFPVVKMHIFLKIYTLRDYKKISSHVLSQDIRPNPRQDKQQNPNRAWCFRPLHLLFAVCTRSISIWRATYQRGPQHNKRIKKSKRETKYDLVNVIVLSHKSCNRTQYVYNNRKEEVHKRKIWWQKKKD